MPGERDNAAHSGINPLELSLVPGRERLGGTPGKDERDTGLVNKTFVDLVNQKMMQPLSLDRRFNTRVVEKIIETEPTHRSVGDTFSVIGPFFIRRLFVRHNSSRQPEGFERRKELVQSGLRERLCRRRDVTAFAEKRLDECGHGDLVAFSFSCELFGDLSF
ncbi:MAG: hypothetical protein BWY42_00851 [Candidatus Omnitrophica bacterium ADurb.Bin277]|nr:MAG: hypothetical protein BWY42_00851 [Candidatus Omnitrophica bacterium ADurb.Bin277]